MNTSLLSVRRAIAAALIVLVIPGAALAERIALVIGNSDYQNASYLTNPRNDAEAISDKLKSLGFDVIEGYDLGIMEMGGKVREFARSSKGAELAMVFYAGHGIEVAGQNYLVPVDALLEDETALSFELMPVDMISAQFQYSDGAHLLFLDACRDNPFGDKLSSATRSAVSRGLGRIEAEPNGTGTAIALATQPGNVALDGEGKHSPFAEALLRHIATPNVSIDTVMTRVTGDVVTATNEEQRPWFHKSFTSDVYLNRVSAPAPVEEPATATAGASVEVASAALDTSVEDEYWTLAKASDTVDMYQLYIDTFPQGRYRGLAIALLNAKKVAQPSEEAPSRDMATRSLVAVSSPSGPLVLTPSPYMRTLVGTAHDEGLLGIGERQFRDQNRIIQARLKAAGYNVGVVDGLIGAGTRRMITQWQGANGLPPSGYFNALQLQLLYQQTETAYGQYLATQRTATYSSGSSKSGSGAGEFANEFFSGVAKGLGEGIGKGLFGN